MKKLLFINVLVAVAITWVSCGGNKSNNEPTTFLAYLKIDMDALQRGSNETLPVLVDELLWISGSDTETLLKYGFDPEEVDDDYELYNEKEEWVAYTATKNTTFRVEYDLERFNIMRRELELDDFKHYVFSYQEKYPTATILANITIDKADKVIRIEEFYVP